MKQFSCGHVVPGCHATFQEDSEDQILEKVAVHAREAHGMDTVPDDVVAQVRSHIVEVA